jgi:hypothetical protein
VPRVDAAPATSAPATLGANAPTPGAGFAVPPGVPPPMFAVANSDQAVSAGLANNFNGRVESVWFLPRKLGDKVKQEKRNTYELFAEVNIRADDATLGRDGIITEYYKVDSLNQWVPSRTDPQWDPQSQRWVYAPAGNFSDAQGNVFPATFEHYMALHLGQSGFPVPGDATGKETAVLPPESWKGWYMVPGIQNSRHGHMKGTKWDQLLDAVKKTGYYQKAPHIQAFDMRQFLVGVYGFWVRIPYEWRGGSKPADAKDSDFLALAEILDLGPISGASGPVQVQVPASMPQVAAMPAQAPAPAPMAAAPSPAPAPVVSSANMTPQQTGAAGQAPVAPTPAAATPSKEMAAIGAAVNEILAQQAQAAGAAGMPVLSAGSAVFEGLNARGLNGAQGLLVMQDKAWLGGDDRTFFYVEHKGMIADTAEHAMALR